MAGHATHTLHFEMRLVGRLPDGHHWNELAVLVKLMPHWPFPRSARVLSTRPYCYKPVIDRQTVNAIDAATVTVTMMVINHHGKCSCVNGMQELTSTAVNRALYMVQRW